MKIEIEWPYPVCAPINIPGNKRNPEYDDVIWDGNQWVRIMKIKDTPLTTGPIPKYDKFYH